MSNPLKQLDDDLHRLFRIGRTYEEVVADIIDPVLPSVSLASIERLYDHIKPVLYVNPLDRDRPDVQELSKEFAVAIRALDYIPAGRAVFKHPNLDLNEVDNPFKQDKLSVIDLYEPSKR